ncbi:TPA: hypothetical protein ACU6JA_005629 [Salmonella enterica]
MKPVTIETVRERLSYLEGLNERGVGTAVSQQQFETACLRELLTLLDDLVAAEKRIAELERSETQLIDERDNAESALNDAYKAVMGQAPEWSNWFSFANAIDEIELACEQWRNQTDDVIQFRQRIAELEARTYIPQPLDIEDECQSYEYVAGWNDCRDAASVRQQTPAVCDVIAERFRQQSVEGWTLEHDDQYGKSQLLWASSCYLLNTIQPFNRIPMDWPWDSSWWKPTNPRRDLVKACALIIAEIERRDRAAGIKVKG